MRRDELDISKIERDELTGLYTREAFFLHSRRYISQDPKADYLVCISDIDNFKMVNAIYGEEMCNRVLHFLADYFLDRMADGVCGRYGGDQFAVLVRSRQEIGVKLVEKNQHDVTSKAPIPSLNLKFGIYEHADPGLSVEEMCERAVLAVKSIKHQYSKVCATYEGEVSQKHIQAQMFEAQFHNAITGREFITYYQPKYNPYTERIVGAEALVRWWNSDGRLIPPGEFLPVFEADGLIAPLDEYVFRMTCEEQKSLADRGLPVLPISVNLSRNSMYQKDVADRYAKIVRDLNISPSCVSIEITETAMTSSREVKPIADAFIAAGFSLDMDDFGSGRSSLSSLNILNFDVVKLDKSLIDFIGDPQGDKVLRYTISLAKELGLHIIAEGVENEKQLSFLTNNGCDEIQGFYYSKPLPADQFEKLLVEDQTKQNANIRRQNHFVLSLTGADTSPEQGLVSGKESGPDDAEAAASVPFSYEVCGSVYTNQTGPCGGPAAACGKQGIRILDFPPMDKVWETTVPELSVWMKYLERHFHAVRIVDPSILAVMNIQDGKLVRGGANCHLIWKRTARCMNCISSKALTERKSTYKFEFLGDRAFLVTATPVQIDGRIYSLETVLQMDDVLMSAFGKNRFRKEIELFNEKVYKDSLTGAYNRRYYDEKASGLYCTGMAMIDIDHFKQINDSYSHDAGDAALKEASRVIMGNIRSSDCLIRYGGDEFILYFYGLPDADRFEKKLRDLQRLVSEIKLKEYPDVRINMSVGGIFAKQPLKVILHSADLAMYEAKKHRGGIVIRTS